MEKITAKKESDFPTWYSQILIQCDMIEYYDISGCYILKSTSVDIWDNIKDYLNKEFRKLGVKNVYFPLFVKRENLEKESSHIEGFKPEVAWITKKQDSKQDSQEPDIAIRPTSETIIYPTAKNWIQSYRDLPIKVNQWANVVRWEFKDATPFIRTREILWQEGHTFYEKKMNADQEVYDILEIYRKTYEEVLCVPVIKGIKTDAEKFCGADFTTTVETYIPECGKAIQGATSHSLGQNFSKIFDIKYYDETGKNHNNFVWQNSWGFSTRSIGVMLMVHSDNIGLVLPPKIAPIQVVIVTAENNKYSVELNQQMQDYIDNMTETLSKYRIEVDRRVDRIGAKYNYWELRGIPIRIEMGTKELSSNILTIFRRDTLEKVKIPLDKLGETVDQLFEDISKNMFNTTKDKMYNCKIFTKNIDELTEKVSNNMVETYFCGDADCEENICEFVKTKKEHSIKTLCRPLDSTDNGKCIGCTKDDSGICLFGRSF